MFSGEVAKCGRTAGWVLGSLGLYAGLRVGELFLSPANCQRTEKLLAYKAEVQPNRFALRSLVISCDRVISLQIAWWSPGASSTWGRGAANGTLLLCSLIVTAENCCLRAGGERPSGTSTGAAEMLPLGEGRQHLSLSSEVLESCKRQIFLDFHTTQHISSP